MYRTSHTGQIHFEQGQDKMIWSWQGTREMAKIEDMEVDNSHNKGDMGR